MTMKVSLKDDTPDPTTAAAQPAAAAVETPVVLDDNVPPSKREQMAALDFPLSKKELMELEKTAAAAAAARGGTETKDGDTAANVLKNRSSTRKSLARYDRSGKGYLNQDQAQLMAKDLKEAEKQVVAIGIDRSSKY